MAPGKKHSNPKAKISSEPAQPPPNWPIFKPLLPASDLSLETVVDSQIIELPLTTTPGKPKKDEALRVNDRFQVTDEAFANRLWIETGLRELICGNGESEDEGEEVMGEGERKELWGGEPVGLNPKIRIYRYSKGQFFGQHYDESNVMTLNTKPTSTPVKTTWTILLYLTSPATGCQGGETVFYPDDLPGKKNVLEKEIVIGLETGMLLLHKHGNECMLVSILV
ncbi:hypothetical protein G7Y89_g5620 [Cudoniella acicularis]|uniref:Prolyl 4-hydroxylase alpha subunit domain-containing protein n=1 Tax=Cudoniella acicularis TaxID=354080 RepID=A0A8H4RPE8_9HELO|nr:hypothetical protein G7Y89_g5620 [Cudoniella acicularis]